MENEGYNVNIGIFYTGDNMSNKEAWSQSIRELLTRHNLTIRGAAIKAGNPSLRTYLGDWLKGQIPQYKTATSFLEHFPREEAIECLAAAGYPPPTDWLIERQARMNFDDNENISYDAIEPKKTVSYILRSTQGTSSYDEIAHKVNEWFRNELAKGRTLVIRDVSASDIQMIYIGMETSPSMEMLEALSAVQGVPIWELFKAAGHSIPFANPELWLENIIAQATLETNGDPDLVKRKFIATKVLQGIMRKYKEKTGEDLLPSKLSEDES